MGHSRRRESGVIDADRALILVRLAAWECHGQSGETLRARGGHRISREAAVRRGCLPPGELSEADLENDQYGSEIRVVCDL